MALRSLTYYRNALAPGRFFNSTEGGRQVPVFMYHHADARTFDQHLRFLADNGYRGTSCDQVDWSDPDPHDVVLTFDDGRRSVWSVAAPLLSRYGFRATAFVSPGMIGEGDPTPTLESAAAGELEARHYGNHELLNWSEAELLARGRSVDLQLHGFAHSRVFVSPRLVGFHHLGLKDRNAGIAGWIVRRDGENNVVRAPDLGEPIYEWGSRWGEAPRYLEDEAVSRSCRAHVRERGGSAFFERPRWREALTEIWRAADRRRCRTPRFETASEKLTHLDDLLQRAKGLLEERTGVKAEHFALPWAEGNEMISDVAAAAGVHHVYWEASIPEYTAGRQWEVRHHHRLKDQSLLRLPGEGRQGLWAVLGVVARSYLDR